MVVEVGVLGMSAGVASHPSEDGVPVQPTSAHRPHASGPCRPTQQSFEPPSGERVMSVQVRPSVWGLVGCIGCVSHWKGALGVFGDLGEA